MLPTILSLLTTLSLVQAQALSGTPSGCPAAVSVENGGFENGQLAPWTTPSAYPTQPALSFVSPGYQSQFAFQMEFAASNTTGWFFGQYIGLQCESSQYFTSFAVNWKDFSIHGDPDYNFCHLGVTSSYCNPIYQGPVQGYYNATNATGWQYYSYTCTARMSGGATFDIDIGCEATYVIPAFTLQMDDFNIQLVGTPAPSQSSSAPSSFTLSATTSSIIVTIPSQLSSVLSSFISSTPSSITLSAIPSPTSIPITSQLSSIPSSFTISASSTVASTVTLSATLSVKTSSTSVPIPSLSLSALSSITSSATTSAMNVPIPSQSSSAGSSLSASATTSSINVQTTSAANKMYRALKIDFLYDSTGLLLLFPHLLYQLLYAN